MTAWTPWYRTGTASVANGATAVTGTLTAWNNSAKEGDGISFDGGAKWYEIAAVGSNTSLTLRTPFGESDVVAGAYAIMRASPSWQMTGDLALKVANLLASSTTILQGSGEPADSLGSDGALYFDLTNKVLYGPKASGTWAGTGYNLAALDVGWRFLWSTNTSVSDPTSGKVKVNNAAPGSATTLSISKTDAAGNSIAAEIAAWLASTGTVKAYLYIRKGGTTGVLLRYSITAGVDHTGWAELTVTGGELTGEIGNGDAVYLVPAGGNGDTGAPGLNGSDPGVRFAFDEDVDVEEPAAGTLRFDNADPEAVTKLCISYASGETGNPDLADWIKGWDGSNDPDIKGQLILKRPDAPENLFIVNITGAKTDHTTWAEFPVAIIAGAGEINTADVLSVQFSRTGKKGADGAGTGDVQGPGASAVGNLAVWSDTGGEHIEDLGIAAADVEDVIDEALRDGGDIAAALGYTPANAATAASTGKAIAMAIVFGG